MKKWNFLKDYLHLKINRFDLEFVWQGLKKSDFAISIFIVMDVIYFASSTLNLSDYSSPWNTSWSNSHPIHRKIQLYINLTKVIIKFEFVFSIPTSPAIMTSQSWSTPPNYSLGWLRQTISPSNYHAVSFARVRRRLRLCSSLDLFVPTLISFQNSPV